MNLLLGVTGSVATIKLSELIGEIKRIDPNVDIRIIATKCSLHFLTDKDYDTISDPLLVDEDEWETWKGRGDPVLHIELRKWANIFLIAPLDANTMAKISSGICDNLLTSVMRAWDFSKPIIVAPAMNTFMWDHPITVKNLETLKTWGVTIIPPMEKTLMCGDMGIGGMASVMTIVNNYSLSAAKLNKDKEDPFERD